MDHSASTYTSPSFWLTLTFQIKIWTWALVPLPPALLLLRAVLGLHVAVAEHHRVQLDGGRGGRRLTLRIAQYLRLRRIRRLRILVMR